MSSGKTCHVCGKMGHVSRECSQRTCRICGGKGHVAATCAKNPANAVRKCRKCGKSGHFEGECHMFSEQKPASVCSRCGGPHELYACTIQMFSAPECFPVRNQSSQHIFVSNLPSRMTKANCQKLVSRFGDVASLHWLQYSVEGPSSTAKDTKSSTDSNGESKEGNTDKEESATEKENAESAKAIVAKPKAGEGSDSVLVGCFVTFENGEDAEKAVTKIHGKKVLASAACAWHMTTVDPHVISLAASGRLAAVERFVVISQKATDEIIREHEISAVQNRLASMEKNMRNASTLDDGSRSKNKHMFGADQEGGTGVWNGMGVTKTTQCPTLIVTNVPRSAKEDDVKTLFSKCTGFFSMRSVRGLYFVDYDSIANATNAMIQNQNYMFSGHDMPTGLCIDYDKDTRSKRNKQYERSRNGNPY